MTNAEKIRLMDDNQLAAFLERMYNEAIEWQQIPCTFCEDGMDCTKDCMLPWLQQESEL